MKNASLSDNLKIALVAFDSLGDGLIYVMMAENLRLNGFAVTYYGNVAYQMKQWFPDLHIKPYPERHLFEQELDGYDLTIMSPPQFMRDEMDAHRTEEARQKWLLICQKCPATWYFDHTERIRNSRDSLTFERLEGLLNCSGSIQQKALSDESVVEMTLQYMKEKMHLRNVTKEVAIAPPSELLHRRFRKRIIISPDSAGPEKKNWTPSSFIKLCHALTARGYSPEIVVAPRNHSAWANMKNNVFPTPCFPDIHQLSSYIYESGAVIANDSGNGHLASFLKIPVITIYRKKNPLFHWRPDWGPGTVVCPKLTIRWINGPIWKPFVRQSQIIAALETFQ